MTQIQTHVSKLVLSKHLEHIFRHNSLTNDLALVPVKSSCYLLTSPSQPLPVVCGS